MSTKNITIFNIKLFGKSKKYVYFCHVQLKITITN